MQTMLIKHFLPSKVHQQNFPFSLSLAPALFVHLADTLYCFYCLANNVFIKGGEGEVKREREVKREGVGVSQHGTAGQTSMTKDVNCYLLPSQFICHILSKSQREG